MKSYKKSSCDKLYLIGPTLYEKMLPLLNDVEKQEIIDLNEEHKDGVVEKFKSKRFPCGVCKKAFTSIFALKRHFKTFHMPECCKYYNARKLHTTPENTETPQTSAEKSVDQKRKVSDMTPNVENETLKKPKWTRGQKRKKSIPQDKVFKQMHLDLKLKSHKCEECGETFNQKGHLKRHINIVHLKLKPYKCEECCKTFSTKDNLKQHCGRPELQTGL